MSEASIIVVNRTPGSIGYTITPPSGVGAPTQSGQLAPFDSNTVIFSGSWVTPSALFAGTFHSLENCNLLGIIPRSRPGISGLSPWIKLSTNIMPFPSAALNPQEKQSKTFYKENIQSPDDSQVIFVVENNTQMAITYTLGVSPSGPPLTSGSLSKESLKSITIPAQPYYDLEINSQMNEYEEFYTFSNHMAILFIGARMG